VTRENATAAAIIVPGDTGKPIRLYLAAPPEISM